MTVDENLQRANQKLVKKLLLVVSVAIVFAFAMVPFYDALCKITGLNGKTGGAASAQTVQARKIDTSRFVTVELNGNAMQGLSWEFGANQNRLRVHPGEIVLTAFHVKNPTNQALMGRAVPSVSPGWTAQYFNKIECFCFKQQTLNPGESKEMPLTFFVSPELPSDVKEIALSYAFFPVGKGS